MRSTEGAEGGGRLIEIPPATSFLELGEGIEYSPRVPPKAGGRLRNPRGGRGQMYLFRGLMDAAATARPRPRDGQTALENM